VYNYFRWPNPRSYQELEGVWNS